MTDLLIDNLDELRILLLELSDSQRISWQELVLVFKLSLLVLAEWRAGLTSISSLLIEQLVELDTFHSLKEHLLVSYNRSRPAESAPGDGFFDFEAILVHQKEANEGACSSKASSAVDGQSLAVSMLPFTEPYELDYDLVTWVGAVRILKIVDLDAFILEVTGSIEPLIESHDTRDAVISEVVDVFHWTNASISLAGSRAAHGDDLARQYPIQVSVLAASEELILIDVEGFPVPPAPLDGHFNCLKHIMDAQIHHRLADTTVSVRHQFGGELSELIDNFTGSAT